jgi:hypothetical protein
VLVIRRRSRLIGTDVGALGNHFPSEREPDP